MEELVNIKVYAKPNHRRIRLFFWTGNAVNQDRIDLNNKSTIEYLSIIEYSEL
jgi:hypothetical protein